MRDHQVVSIGNGIYARTQQRMSLMDEYRELQRTCEHSQRDPRGQCYKCGDRRAIGKKEDANG
jgi:hypothetical protein